MGNNANLLVKARQTFKDELTEVKKNMVKTYDLSASPKQPLSVKEMETSKKNFDIAREGFVAQMIENHKNHGTFLAQDKKEEVAVTL